MDEREAMFILHLKKYTTKVIQFIILHPQERAPTPNSGLQNIIWERGSQGNTRSPVPALIWYVTQNKNLQSARRNSTLQTRKCEVRRGEATCPTFQLIGLSPDQKVSHRYV